MFVGRNLFLRYGLLLCGLVASVALSVSSGAAEPESAWEVFLRRDDSAEAIPAAERTVLEALTARQAADFARGLDPASIILTDGSNLAELLSRVAQGGTFNLSKYTLDSGGASSGGGFRLTTTMGQAEAGLLTGGDFSLTGGFQARANPPKGFFNDGFESGGFMFWSSTAGGS